MIVETLIVKIQKEVYEDFKKNVNLDDLKDDVLWAAQDMLLDETSIDNYVKAVSELNCLESRSIHKLTGFPIIINKKDATPEIIAEVTESLKNEYNPENKWDDIKFLNVRHEAEWEVTQYLRDNGFLLDILYT